MALRFFLLAARISTAAPFSTAANGLVHLAGGKARLFKAGNPIVYGGAVQRVDGKPLPGDVVDVVDGKGTLIGWGVFNPDSMYRVRLLATREPSLLAHRDVRALLRERLASASQLRAAAGLPSESTSAYRLVNSEGDRLSGLTVDVFGSTAVAVTSARWLELRSQMVVDEIAALDGIDEVVWRRSDARLKQDGWSAPPPQGEDGAAAAAPPPPSLEVLESGLKYRVSPHLGQKSGFYCDQRENRRQLAELCAGRRVLDLFCYSGGFAISAAARGASECVGVDSSSAALALARGNAELNGVGAACEFVQADVHKWLRDGVGDGARDPFDVVVCDPPKLAPSVKDLPRAKRKYKQLNANAVRALRPGGLLLSCSCSAAMTQSGGFVQLLHEAAQAEGRRLTVLRVAGAAPDHVINPGYQESSYLTAVLAHVE